MSSIEPHTFHSKGQGLSNVLAQSTTWERTLVPIGSAARLALAAISALLTLVAVGQYTLHERLAGIHEPDFCLFGWAWFEYLLARTSMLGPVYVVLALGLLAAGVLTSGFSIAGRRLQIGLGLLALLSAGALIPPLGLLLLAAANLVAWVAIGVLAVAIGIAVLWALLAGALDS